VATSRSSRSSAAPSVPVSPKPAVMTTTFSMPAAPDWRMVSTAIFGGTTTTATSMLPGESTSPISS